MSHDENASWLVEPAKSQENRANWWGADSCEYVTIIDAGLIYEEEDEADCGESFVGGIRSDADNHDPIGSYSFDS